MKKGLWRRTGACIALLALLVTCLSGGTIAEPVDPEDAVTPDAAAGEPLTGFSQVAESEQAILCLNTDTHVFYVENKATGYRWSSAPTNMEELEINEYMQGMMMSMLDIDFYNHELEADNTASGYQNAVADGGVAYESVDNGFKVTFSFTDMDLSIPLQVTLEGDHVKALVDTKAIKYDPAKLSLLQLHILPYMGAISYINKSGYALLPDGSGALVYATTNKENAPAYQKPVFGKDITIDATDYEGVTLPCFGLADGENALLAVIDEDSADAYVNCESNGQATMYTHPWASFKTDKRRAWKTLMC